MNSKILGIAFGVKFVLDVFSPARDVNLAIEVCLFGLLLLSMGKQASILCDIPFYLLGSFAIASVIVSSFNEMSLKNLVCVLFYASCYVAANSIPVERFFYPLRLAVSFGFISCFILILVSVAAGLYSQREVFNFEHVNLFGSYIVFLSALNVYLQYVERIVAKGRKQITVLYRYSSLLLSLLSTSTGAFIVVLSSFLPVKYLTFRNLWKVILSATIGVVVLFITTSMFSQRLNHKIFGFMDVFTSVRAIEKFYRLSKLDLNVDLTKSMKEGGSFAWRIYNYISYITKFTAKPPQTILFGGGAGSYVDYKKMLPHNDFIYLLLDFGLVGISFILFGLIWLLRTGLKSGFSPLAYLCLFLILRLGFENVVSSTYLLSLVSGVLGLVVGTYKQLERRKIYFGRSGDVSVGGVLN